MLNGRTEIRVRMSIVTFSFFFFEQKTTYDMRISDWSSVVCSSDLLGLCLPRRMLAMIVATRLTTRPSASISTHFFSTVAAFADAVVLVSAFMARSLTEMDW